MAATKTTSEISPQALAILGHVLVETPAGLNFIFRPAFTLSSPSPAALPVIRQYGLLLLVVNGLLILLLLEHCRDLPIVNTLTDIVGIRSLEQGGHVSKQLMGKICLVISIYHIGPIVRAMSQHQPDPAIRTKKAYGGARVIATIHAMLGAMLLGAWVLS